MKNNQIIPYDPTLKISFLKKLKMKWNIKLEKIKLLKNNKNIIFFKDMILDIFIYSLCGTIIMIPFVSSPIFMGLSFGTGVWFYLNRIHHPLKEILGSISLVNTGRFNK